MSNPWFRLYSEFSHDPKIQRMSEADQRRFVMLLCIRCSNGDVTLQDDDVTFQLRISNEEWQVTKALFLSKNLIDEGNNPVAWDKRQFVSDSSAPRVARHRAKIKEACNVTVTPPEQNRTDTESKTLVVSELTPCPHSEIISLYAELLPELPQVRKWEGTRARHLKARWAWVLADLKSKGKPFDKASGLDFFRRMFGYIAKSNFLMGRSGGFSCTLPWIVMDENFTKIIEGNYENKAQA